MSTDITVCTTSMLRSVIRKAGWAPVIDVFTSDLNPEHTTRKAQALGKLRCDKGVSVIYGSGPIVRDIGREWRAERNIGLPMTPKTAYTPWIDDTTKEPLWDG